MRGVKFRRKHSYKRLRLKRGWGTSAAKQAMKHTGCTGMRSAYRWNVCPGTSKQGVLPIDPIRCFGRHDRIAEGIGVSVSLGKDRILRSRCPHGLQ